jgi:membrane dipeptidase
MRSAGMILDTTHLSDESFWEVVLLWDGPIVATHQMCRTVCPGERQFTDQQLKVIIERNGIIGAALDAWMFTPGWIKGVTENKVCSLELYVDHIDHVCQLAGNANHAAIGTDLDGGYGQEQTPHDLDTIADLQKVSTLLATRGYSDEDIRKIFHGNAVRFLRNAWSA